MTTEEICRLCNVTEEEFWQVIDQLARQEGLTTEDWLALHVTGYRDETELH